MLCTPCHASNRTIFMIILFNNLLLVMFVILGHFAHFPFPENLFQWTILSFLLTHINRVTTLINCNLLLEFFLSVLSIKPSICTFISSISVKIINKSSYRIKSSYLLLLVLFHQQKESRRRKCFKHKTIWKAIKMLLSSDDERMRETEKRKRQEGIASATNDDQ